MNILVTGSNGFVGTYFIDSYMDSHNIKTFSFLNDEFLNLNMKNIDTIIHLSALVHQMDGASKEEYEQVNVIQTLDLARKAKDTGVEHFIFMSTIKVYGEETNISYTEDTVCKPIDEYGKSKLKAEIELKKLENDNFIISIIRTPIIYGYGVKANIGNLINLIKKVPLLPFNQIENKRSMVYIGNLCYLIDRIIENKQNGIFLASDEKPLSTTIFIKYIADALDKKIYLVKIPFFENLLRLVKPSFHKRLFESLEVDNSKTKKILNLQNPYSVKDGIKYMIRGEL